MTTSDHIIVSGEFLRHLARLDVDQKQDIELTIHERGNATRLRCTVHRTMTSDTFVFASPVLLSTSRDLGSGNAPDDDSRIGTEPQAASPPTPPPVEPPPPPAPPAHDGDDYVPPPPPAAASELMVSVDDAPAPPRVTIEKSDA